MVTVKDFYGGSLLEQRSGLETHTSMESSGYACERSYCIEERPVDLQSTLPQGKRGWSNSSIRCRIIVGKDLPLQATGGITEREGV